MKAKKWIYETKCRRCGEINIFSPGGSVHTSWEAFLNLMFQKINQPQLCNCIKCKKDTIQELVSYGDVPLLKKKID